MITQTGLDREAPEELFVEHQTRQLVGQGEGAERKAPAGGGDRRRVEPEVGADQEGDRMRPLLAQAGEAAGQSRGVERFAERVERHRPAGVGEGGEEGLPFGAQALRVTGAAARP